VPSGPIYPSRRTERRSRVVTALIVLGLLVVGEAITVVLFASPAPPKDLALITAIVVAPDVMGLAVTALWARITRKRRQYQCTG